MDIIYSKSALKSLKTVEKRTRERIINAINKHLPDIPFTGDIKGLKGSSELYRLRVGTWRVLFETDEKQVIISKISPRGQAYK